MIIGPSQTESLEALTFAQLFDEKPGINKKSEPIDPTSKPICGSGLGDLADARRF